MQQFGEIMLHGNIYTQLSLEKRTMIHTQLERGIKPAAIAVVLNHSPSTLSREFRRNGWVRPPAHRGSGRPPVAGGYRADAAQTRIQACTVVRCAPPAARNRLVGSGHLLPRGTLLVRADCGTLALVHSDTPSLQVSHETI